jgi:hypothetical protein
MVHIVTYKIHPMEVYLTNCPLRGEDGNTVRPFPRIIMNFFDFRPPFAVLDMIQLMATYRINHTCTCGDNAGAQQPTN